MALRAIALAVAALAASVIAVQDTGDRSSGNAAQMDPLQSLVVEPLDAGALLRLRDAPGIRAQSRVRLLALAGQVTRRDIQVQSTLIADAAARGDHAAGLMQLDRVLLVYPAAGPAAFTGLAASAGDAELHELLARYADRPWFPGLLANWAVRAEEPANAAALIVLSRLRPAQVPDGTVSTILTRMIEQEQFDQAVNFASQISGLKADDPRTFSIDAVTIDRRISPFAWTLGDDRAGQAVANGAGAIAISIAPGARFAALRRLMALAPGRYRITQRIDDTGEGTVASWSVTCIGKGGPIAAIGSLVTIPIGCALQQWQLVLTAPDQRGEQQLRISELRLQPV